MVAGLHDDEEVERIGSKSGVSADCRGVIDGAGRSDLGLTPGRHGLDRV